MRRRNCFRNIKLLSEIVIYWYLHIVLILLVLYLFILYFIFYRKLLGWILICILEPVIRMVPYDP